LQFVIFLKVDFLKCYIFYIKNKGLKMFVLIKNAEILFEKFEEKLDALAEKYL
jgi:hypothetical protein